MSLKIKCKIDKLVYTGDNGYKVMGCSPLETKDELRLNKYMSFTICGANFPYITEGKQYELEIEEDSTAKYPATYNVISCPSIDVIDLKNLTKDEAYEILMDCTSSERIAKNILKAYPNFIDIILTDGKEAIDTSKIYGVGESYLSAYSRELLEKYKYYHIIKKYNMYKIDVNDCKKMIDTFKDENGIDKEIVDNPYYVLIEVLGVAFETADRIIIGYREDLIESKERCEALIISVLRRNENDGSTRLSGSDLYYYIKEEYNVPYLIPMLKDVSENSGYIYYDQKSKDLSVMETYLGECKVSDFVKNKLNDNTKLKIDWSKYTKIDDFQMTTDQSNCLKNLCECAISLLVGYSGTGKTTSVKGLISLMEDNKLSYCLLAPTGKASLRMSEATHRKCSTIHRKVLRDKEIFSDVIIVDEMSMVDLPTFMMLINAITNLNCRIILCGDNAQLLPVGVACIFNDIINSNIVPITMLTEVFRYNSDGALFVATNVRQGIPFFNMDNDLIKRKDNVLSIGKNYKFIQTDDIFNVLISEYMKLIHKGNIKPDDILCLSPFNVGEDGTYAINSAIQAEINPPKPNEIVKSREIGKRNIIFRLGDRSLNKKNDYKALPLDSYNTILNDNTGKLKQEDVPLTSIFNGQDGVIRQISDKIVVIQFDEELIVFDKNKLSNLLLSYCISVHSSQGSESKYVINVVSPKHSKMLNRNLLYVADTRSKGLQTDIGDMETYNNALLIDGNEQRNTFLPDLLVDKN